jgi:serine/threonine protein kinase
MSDAPTSSASMELRNWEQVDEICLEFEDQWRQGRRPAIENYVPRLAGEAQRQLVRELLLIDLSYRRRMGQTPRADDYADKLSCWQSVADEIFCEGGAETIDRREVVAGAVIGRYAIERELGRGGYGIVYLARDEKLGRPVAIKVPGDDKAASREQVARLVEEARAAARLRHPGIVAVYDVQPLADGGLFAVLEYVEGRTLREALAERPSWLQLARWFGDIADALSYAHAQGFIHRDLTPDNILLDAQDRPHITDFGLAVHDDQQRLWPGERAGSLAYMSPEQVRGETHRLDGRSDLWSFGVMLYEALTGRRPFDSDGPDDLIDEIQQQSPRPPRQWTPAVPAGLERICLRCLSRTPEERPASAGDVANQLRRFVHGRTGPWRYLAAAALLPLALVAGLLAWNGIRTQDAARTTSPSPADDRWPDRLDVLIWKDRRWNLLSTPGLLPLREGDQLRIEARCAEPMFFYLVWIDVQAEIVPIYPWQNGVWETRGTEVASLELRLPAGGPDQVWSMQASRQGTEVVLLLARPAPLPPGVDLLSLLLAVEWPVEQRLPAAWRLDYQHLEPLTKDRSPNVRTARTVQDPLLRLQRHLQTLRTTFPVMQALFIPTQ